jgi:hypothetical protein
MSVINDLMGGIGIGTGSGTAGSLFAPILTLMYILLIFVMLFVCGWFIWNILSYNYNVLILDKRGKYTLRLNRSGKMITTKSGVKLFKIRGYNGYVNLPQQEYIYETRGFLKKGFVTFYKFGEDSFTPVKTSFWKKLKDKTPLVDSEGNISPNEDLGKCMKPIINSAEVDNVKLNPIEQDSSDIRRLIEETQAKFNPKGFFEQYGSLLMTVGGFGLIAATQIFIVFIIKDMVGNIGGISASFERAADSLAACNVASAP